MKSIQLWSIEQSEGLKALPLESVDSSETEALLEELLVQSPGLLIPDGTLVGRQLPTEGGPLDLLGVDSDGRLVVFELKRGTLTRDAIAQVLDYASDLAGRDPETLARLIEEHSGKRGIEKFADFLDWFARENPSAPDPLAEEPRMILVGLGVDDRALRIVEFLSSSSVDIQLLTFQAFRAGSQIFLARQVETTRSMSSGDPAAQSKEGNRRILLEKAEQLGVKPLLEDVAKFLADLMSAYQWPGKTSYAFSLAEQTSQGRTALRSYATLYVNQKEPGALVLYFPSRAADVAGDALTSLIDAVPTAIKSGTEGAVEIGLTASTWPDIEPELRTFLGKLVEGWKRKADREAEGAAPEEPEAEGT